VAWRRAHAVPSGTVLSTWRTAVGPAPLQQLQQLVLAAVVAEHGDDAAEWRTPCKCARCSTPCGNNNAAGGDWWPTSGAFTLQRCDQRRRSVWLSATCRCRTQAGDNCTWKWKRVRLAVFTPEVAATSLARMPYDLRHAAVSTWLNGGVPPDALGHGP
jgi:hypothetical protein